MKAIRSRVFGLAIKSCDVRFTNFSPTLIVFVVLDETAVTMTICTYLFFVFNLAQ